MTFSYTDILIAAGSAVLAFGAGPTLDAKSLPCSAAPVLRQALLDDFGQTLDARYVVDRGEVMVFKDPTHSRWTVTLTDNSGMACVVESGAADMDLQDIAL